MRTGTHRLITTLYTGTAEIKHVLMWTMPHMLPTPHQASILMKLSYIGLRAQRLVLLQTGFHTCCFECEICSDGKYINHTGTEQHLFLPGVFLDRSIRQTEHLAPFITYESHDKNCYLYTY
jgi:hypothetical protein